MARLPGVLCLVVFAATLGCSRRQPDNSILIPFESGNSWGYKNSRGQVVIEPRFALANEFSTEGIAAVVEGSEWFYIDRSGKKLLRPLVVDNGPDYFSEGLARFRQDGRIGFFDVRGRIAIEPRFDFALPFSDGMAAFCEGCREEREGEHLKVAGGKWGFIDRSGRMVIQPAYQEAESFSGGWGRVRTEGRWLRVDRHGLEQR